jgi:hypothetical protein
MHVEVGDEVLVAFRADGYPFHPPLRGLVARINTTFVMVVSPGIPRPTKAWPKNVRKVEDHERKYPLINRRQFSSA